MNASATKFSTSSALIIDPTFPTDWENDWGTAFAGAKANNLRAPIIVRSAPEALRYLSGGEVQFGAIYMNAVLTPPGVLNLIRMSHKVHVATPIFILYDASEGGGCPFSAQEMNRLAIQGAIERRSQQDFLRQLRPPTINLNDEKVVPVAPSQETESDEYISIPIQRFNFSSKIFFDVFIRVADEKFLKIHPAGSPLPETQLRNYMMKGVANLYFQRVHHQRCLEYCDLLERTFLSSTGLSPAVKLATMLNRGHATLNALRNHRKVSEGDLEDILSFTNDVRRVLTQLNLDKIEDVRALMQNVSAYQHSLGTTVLSLVLAKPLDLEHEQSAEILGVASFLHDVGLLRLPPSVQSENLSLMIGSEKELYWQHPIIGAEILRDSGSVHPVAIQVVAQHHERRNGSGFPNNLTGQQIHKIAEVVALSEDFARVVQARAGAPFAAVFKEMETKSYELFSLQVMEAFQKVFAPFAK